VQYNRIDDAKKLIKEAELPLILKGNKLGKKNNCRIFDKYLFNQFRYFTSERSGVNKYNIIIK
jgi:hypothetical protein